MSILRAVWILIRALLVERSALALENLALRQQLAVLKRATPRPRLRRRDRLFWVVLSRLWRGWRKALVLVQPQTVVRWHQLGFRLFWRWKSRARQGRPPIDAAVRALIRRISRENALWGAPRIRAELRLLGHEVAESTVAKYMVRRKDKPPSQTWRTFLRNHAGCLASMDFFVVPTVTFRLLYGFLILRHERRCVAHFAVTAAQTAAWVAQQLREAFPYGEAPRYLIRDRDGIYGEEVRRCLRGMDIEEVVIAPRSPWQSPFVERLIGSLRRELLDHVIVLNERHLRRLLSSFFDYYHQSRPHRALDQNAPEPREVEPPGRGRVIALPQVGGLHHRYRRAA
jgi:transposase InsO family protein